jgi:hypothetical protein
MDQDVYTRSESDWLTVIAVDHQWQTHTSSVQGFGLLT